MLRMLIVLLILIAYYVTYKFCKSAATDNQELEDKLFLEIYVYGKSIKDSIFDNRQDTQISIN